MRRREFMAVLVGVLGIPSPVTAQRAKQLPVVGLVTGLGTVAQMGKSPSPPLLAFLDGVRNLGWIDGSNIVIEQRSAEDDPQRAPAIIAELLALGTDIIVVTGARWLQDAALRATRIVPIVAHFPEDPVAAGLITGLSRPGGNITGVTLFTGAEFHGKQLQLLLELVPRVNRVALLAPRRAVEQYRDVARPPGITVVPVETDHAGQIEAAFATIQREQVQAVLVGGGPVNFNFAPQIVAFVAENRLPAAYAFRESAGAGGLVSYGPSVVGNFRQMARLVDRILKGAKPGDLPVEQPTKFELVLNLKTAKALGVTIAPLLLAQVDEVIE